MGLSFLDPFKKIGGGVLNFASRAYDQINPVDAGLSFNTRKANPLKAQQSAWQQTRDIFDANTTHDQGRRLQQQLQMGMPVNYQSPTVRDYRTEQADLFGDRRSYSNPAQYLLGSTARYLNTGAAAISEAIETGRGTLADYTGNMDALRASNERLRLMKEDMYDSESGLLGAGTIFDTPEEREEMGAAEMAKRMAGTTVGTAGEVIPVGHGLKAVKLGKLAPVGSIAGKSKLARFGGNAAEGAIGDFGEQLAMRDDVNPFRLATSAVAGGTLPIVIRGGGNVVKAAAGSDTAKKATKNLVLDGIESPNVAQSRKAVVQAQQVVNDIIDGRKPRTQLPAAQKSLRIAKEEFVDAYNRERSLVGLSTKEVDDDFVDWTNPKNKQAQIRMNEIHETAKARNKAGKKGVQEVFTPEETAELAELRQSMRSKKPEVKSNKPVVELHGKPKKNKELSEVLGIMSGGRTAADTSADVVSNKLRLKAKKLGVKLDDDFINRYQTGQLKTRAEKQMGATIKQETDKIFKTQEALNPNIEYRKNYLPQVYKQADDEVEQAVNKFQTATGAGNRRTFQTFDEASAYGLESKYKTIDQMIGANSAEVKRAMANREAMEAGLESGLFQRVKGKDMVEVQGFDGVYANKKVANVINEATQEATSAPAKIARLGKQVNSVWQDVMLAGGIPYTPANFFVFGQMVKDMTAGRVGVTLDVLRSFSKDATAKRFAQEADFVDQMAQRGLRMSHASNLTNESRNAVSTFWGRAVNQPTFQQFMPNQYLSLSKKTYNKALKKGLSEAEALDLAANTTKAFYGVTDELARGRSRLSSDIMGTVLFAPRYRESILNTLFNSVKSVSPHTWGDRSLDMNRRLLAGMGVTFYAMNEANKAINGHGVFENRENQELSLQVPYGDVDEKGNQKVFNIPFMPGFMTIPRAAWNAIGNAMEGDVGGVIGEGGKALSAPMKVASEAISNKDYFGNPLRIDETVAAEEGVDPDSMAKQAADTGLHVVKQAVPGWVRGGIEYAKTGKTEKAVAEALEAPVRFGTLNPDRDAYFTALEETRDSLNANQKAVFDQLHPKGKNIRGEEIKDTNPNKRRDKANLLKQNPEMFNAEAGFQKRLKEETGQAIDPVYEQDWDKAQQILWARSLAPGESGELKQELLYGQPWYKDFADAEDKYYKAMEKKFGKRDDPFNYPERTPEMNALLDAYYKLEKGTGERSDFIDANPQILDYWDKKREATNKHRISLGLPPLKDEEFDGKSYFASKSGSGRRGRGGSSSTAAQAANKYKYAVRGSGKGNVNAKVAVRDVGTNKGAPAKVARVKAPKVTLKKSKV